MKSKFDLYRPKAFFFLLTFHCFLSLIPLILYLLLDCSQRHVCIPACVFILYARMHVHMLYECECLYYIYLCVHARVPVCSYEAISWMLLQSTQAWCLALTWRLTTIHYSSSRGSYV